MNGSFDFNDLAFIASLRRAGVVLLGTAFGDAGNSLSPGTSATTSVTVPAGTTTVIVGVDHYVNPGGAFTTATIGGVNMPNLARSTDTTAGRVVTEIYELRSSIPSGTVNVILSGRASTNGSIHTTIWFLSGGGLTTANWRFGATNSGSTISSNYTVSIAPQTTSGIILGHVAFRTPGTCGAIAASNMTELAQDSTTSAADTNTNSLRSSYGSIMNTSTSARGVGGTVAVAVRAGALAIWIPDA